jgi:GNAT superfamily N-acetyltransferase
MLGETNLARVTNLDTYEPRTFSPPKTAAFRRWFGQSAVVDARGQPLVVYHGTDADFDVFDLGQAGRRTVGGKWAGPAAYFTSSLRLARSYATHERVLPVYLSLQNPYVFDAEGAGWRSVFPEVVDSARAHGHDGVIVRNVRDAARQWDVDLVADTYVVFDADQVRLADRVEPALEKTRVERLPVAVKNAPPQSPAFTRWFAGSKVVDEAGVPRVVYHGTGQPLDSFQTAPLSGKTTKYQAMWGAHFTENPDMAQKYADGVHRGPKSTRGPGHVHPVYLAIRNPLDLTSTAPIPDGLAETLPLKAQRALRAQVKDRARFGDTPATGYLFLLEPVLEGMPPGEARAWMESAGYDGVRYEARYGQHRGYRSDISWVAFSPTQIKAVTSAGFDPEDTRIERLPLSPKKPEKHARAPNARTLLPEELAYDQARAEEDRLYAQAWRALVQAAQQNDPTTAEARSHLEALLERPFALYPEGVPARGMQLRAAAVWRGEQDPVFFEALVKIQERRSATMESRYEARKRAGLNPVTGETRAQQRAREGAAAQAHRQSLPDEGYYPDLLTDHPNGCTRPDMTFLLVEQVDGGEIRHARYNPGRWGATHHLRYVVDDEPVAGLTLNVTQRKVATIERVFTDPAYRRQGYARALLDYAKSYFRSVKHSKDLTAMGARWAEQVERMPVSRKANVDLASFFDRAEGGT